MPVCYAMDAHVQQPQMSLQPLIVQLSNKQFNTWEEALESWEDVQDLRRSSCGSSKAQRYIMYLIDQSKSYQRPAKQDKCSDVGNNPLTTESNGIAADVKEGVIEDNQSKDSELQEQSATSKLCNPLCLTTMESGQAKICAGDYYSGFDELCSASPLAKEALISVAIQYLCKDMVKLLKCTKLLRGIECAEDLQRFSWEEVLHEFNDLCPDLVTLIDTLLQQCRLSHSTLHPPKVKRPNVAVGMILAQLLHFQDPINYRATQQITSLLLHLSGCKDQRTYLSLSHLGVCLGPSSTLDIVKRLKTKPAVCETFKATDLGSLGRNSRPLKLGSIALKCRETKEQEEVLKQLKEEEMEVEDQWKDQLKQAAAEIGLDEDDLNNSDSEESSGSSINVFSSGDNIDEDRLEEIQFDRRPHSDLKLAAQKIGIVMDDSVKSNCSYSTDDFCGDDDDSSKGANQDGIEHSHCTDLGNGNNKFVYTEHQSSENAKSCGAQISQSDLKLRKEHEKLDMLLSGEKSALQQYGEDSVPEDTIGTTESAQLEQTHNHTNASNKRPSKQPQSPPNAKRAKRHEDSKQQHRKR